MPWCLATYLAGWCVFGKPSDGFLAGVLVPCTDRHCSRASLGDACGRGNGGRAEQRGRVCLHGVVEWCYVGSLYTVTPNTMTNERFRVSFKGVCGVLVPCCLLRLLHTILYCGHTAGCRATTTTQPRHYATMSYQAEMTRPIPCVPPVTRKFFPVPASTAEEVGP